MAQADGGGGGYWKRCNTCKREIGHSTDHYVCSVSTCHRKGTDFVFCSVECWEAHVPLFRHRDAWAEERRSPARGAPEAARRETGVPHEARTAPPPAQRPHEARTASQPEQRLHEARTASQPAQRPHEARTPPPPAERPMPRPPAASGSPVGGDAMEGPPLELRDRREIPEDILVVASKLKAYIRARSGMNTSDGVLPRLSRVLRDLCDEAIERAHADGRKTVMDRDLP